MYNRRCWQNDHRLVGCEQLVYGGLVRPSSIHYMFPTTLFGAHSTGETPVLIPNTEAKPSSGDNTPTGEGSTVPNYTINHPKGWFLFCLYNGVFSAWLV